MIFILGFELCNELFHSNLPFIHCQVHAIDHYIQLLW